MKCTACKRETILGKRQCEVCAASSKVARDKAKSEGLCSQFCGSAAREGKLRCENCAKKKGLYDSKRREKLKSIVYSHYGAVCACCGETEPTFLTVDHVLNDGYKDRAVAGYRLAGAILYAKIAQEGFPDTFQILCWNCNCGKRMNDGVCVHQDWRTK